MSKKLLFFSFILTACGEQNPTKPANLALLDTTQIVNGTRSNQLVALDAGQRLAIGWLHSPGWVGGNFCTATLIAPNLVVTASHCTEGRRASQLAFGIGTFPSDACATFNVARLFEHPRLDAALLVLENDAVARVPQLKPLPINRVALDRSWIGRQVEASGFGQTHDRNRSGRWFAVLRFAGLDADEVVVDGEGQRGICFGDSGGPLLALDGAGLTHVLAVESRGAQSCVGRDWMTRLDAILNWIEPIERAHGIANQPRPEGDNPEPLSDPCDNLDYQGRCEGAVAHWCKDEVYHSRDCAESGLVCRFLDDARGYYCGEAVDEEQSSCGDISYLGRCDAEVVEFCLDGELQREDCGARGQSCLWIDDRRGYYCGEAVESDDDLCAQIGYFGRCNQGTVEFCLNGELQREDCGARNQECGWIDDSTGYYCQ